MMERLRETDRDLNLDHATDDDNRGGDAEHPPAPVISCSICLDSVEENGIRSTAKLQCGHGFHLDCIGSAFNMKGEMQCPNCRRVESGQWLYITGPVHSLAELSIDNLIADEDVYDLSYSEMPFQVQWCPLGDLAQLGSSFEEVDSSSTMFQNVHGHPVIFAERTAVPSIDHSIGTYVGPIPPASSGPNDTPADSFSSYPWIGTSRRSEIFNPHTSSALNSQYHGWRSYSARLPISGGHNIAADPNPVPPVALRSSHGDVDAVTIPRALTQPFVFHHGFGPRGGNSLATPTVPHHPVSRAQSSESNHVYHPIPYQQQSSDPQGMHSPLGHGIRRFNVPRSTTMAVPSPPTHHDPNGGIYMVPPSLSVQNTHEAGFPLPNHLYHFQNPSFDRETGGLGPFLPVAGPFSGNISGSGWPNCWPRR